MIKITLGVEPRTPSTVATVTAKPLCYATLITERADGFEPTLRHWQRPVLDQAILSSRRS